MIQKSSVSSVVPRRAFTLIELLVVIAIVAILAAILFPVFARAKTSAKTAATASNLRQIGMAANLYLNDYDDQTVLPQWGELDQDHIWAAMLQPYLKSRSVCFDPSRSAHEGESITLSNGISWNWSAVTSLSINDGGYSTWMETTNGGCTGKRLQNYVYTTNYHYGRDYTSIEDPGQRVAFAPTLYPGNDVGWKFFRNYAANWITPTPETGSFFNALVIGTMPLYAGGSIPVVHADGSVGKLRRKDFKDTNEAPDLASYCQWMNDEGKRVWGPYWSAN